MKIKKLLILTVLFSGLAQARYQSDEMPSNYESAGVGRNTFIFDPRHRSWSAYDGSGRLINSGRASGGRGYCPDVRRGCRTPVGQFSVYSKGSSYCKSSKFPLGRGGAPMPYCMFFRGGFAIHGSPDVPDYNASHGCIRVPPRDARWLSESFVSQGTRVIVRPY